MGGGGNIGILSDNSDSEVVVSLSLESRLFVSVQDHLHFSSTVVYLHWSSGPLLLFFIFKTENVAGLLERTQQWRLRKREDLLIMPSKVSTYGERNNNTLPLLVSRKERLTCDILLELFRSFSHPQNTYHNKTNTHYATY